MKQRMQGMVMGVLITVLLFGSVTAWAATTQTIEVTFGNIRTTLLGQEFVVRDEQGVIIEPFTYNDRVYVSVDTILRAMRSNAQWDEATSTLNFGAVEQPPVARERAPLNTAAPFFDTGVTGPWNDRTSVVTRDSVTMGGTRYQNVIVYRSRNQTALSGANNLFTLHNLRGEYQLLSGYIGRIDGSGMLNTTVKFFGDGELIQTYRLTATNMPIPISLPVTGVTQLRVEFSFDRASNTRTEYALQAFLE